MPHGVRTSDAYFDWNRFTAACVSMSYEPLSERFSPSYALRNDWSAFTCPAEFTLHGRMYSVRVGLHDDADATSPGGKTSTTFVAVTVVNGSPSLLLSPVRTAVFV